MSESTERKAGWFENFMASGYGRLVRIAVGVALLIAGLFLAGRPVGAALAVAGLVPIGAGLFNFCPVAPLWGGHFLGSKYCRSISTGAADGKLAGKGG